MDLVPAIPDSVPPQPTQSGALVPLATTGLRRAGGELPPVCLHLTPSTLIGLRVYLEEFTRQLAAQKPASTTARTYLKRGRFFITCWSRGRRCGVSIGPVSKPIAPFDRRFPNPRTKNGYLTAIRQFLTFLACYHPSLVNPADFVQGWSCSRTHTRRHLPVEDAKALLAALESDPRKSELQRVRNVAMTYLMLKTGLRTIEVSRARLAHLQEQVPGKVWWL